MEPTDTSPALRLRRDDVKARIFGEPRVSTRIGRYALLRRLGAGGVGVVYSAYDDELDRKVALKLVAAQRLGPGTVARVRREAQALARLSHPAVVHVYEVGEAEGHAFVAMEFVAGETLRAYQEAPGRTAAEILAAYVQAGEGLSAAHAAGVVHRDFKPDNVLVGADGRVRVVDFGLALVRGAGLGADVDGDVSDQTGPDRHVLEDSEDEGGDGSIAEGARLTATGALVGTPAYMAPEQLDGVEADARADLFSFASALYEALYGRRPYAGTSAAALREAIAAGAIEAPARDPGLPAAIRRALLRGLDGAPERRWPDMAALLAALRRPARARARIFVAVLSVMSAGALALALAYARERPEADAEALGRERARAQVAEEARERADRAAAAAQRREQDRRLIAASVAAGEEDPGAALLFAAHAVAGAREAGDAALVDAEQALRDALGGVRSVVLVDPGATAPLRQAALAGDGGWAATRDDAGVLRLWRLPGPGRSAAPELRGRFAADALGVPAAAASALAFTGEGRLLIARADASAAVIDLSSAAITGALATGGPARSLLVAPEGERALALLERGAHLLDLAGVEPPRPLTGLSGQVSWARFSPDGAHLLTIEGDGAARLWAARDGRPVATLRGPTRGRGRPGGAFSPTGDRLVLVGPRGAEVFTSRGARTQLLRSPGEVIVDAVFTGDAAAILTLSEDGVVRRFIDEGPLGRVDLVAHDAAVGGARFLAGGERLLGTPFAGAIWLWSADERGEPLALRGHTSSVRAAIVDDRGDRLLSIAHGDPRARLWHLGDDPRVRRGHDGVIERLQWSADGRALVSAAMDGTARIWPREGGAPEVLRRHVEESSVALALHPGGQMIATASTDGAARLWRVSDEPGESALLASPVERGPAPIGLLDLAWSPAGDLLALAGEDGALRLWVLAGAGTKNELKVMSLGTGPISHVRWTSDGARLITTDGDGRIRAIPRAAFGDPAAIIELGDHGAAIRDLALASDGRRLATAGADGRALVVSLAGDAPSRALVGHEHAVWALDFDPEGRRLATASADESARIWDLSAPEAPPIVLRGHTQAVLDVVFAPDGAALVTASADGSARIWRQGQVLEDMSEWTSVILPHAGTRPPGAGDCSVWVAAFSPDGAAVATGAADGVVRVFPLALAPLLAEACARAGRSLGAAELARVGLDPATPSACP